jgi:hypothetical protein
MQTTTIAGADIAVGDTVVLPHWLDKRPEGVRSNVVHKPREVASILEYPESRVLYLKGGSYGIVGRTAVVERVTR